MSAARHTPGPWEAEHRKSDPPDGPNDPGYWSIDATINHQRATYGDGPVADTMNRDYRIHPDEDRANARLIAAAPDLLDALIECHNLLALRGLEGQSTDAAKIAIAKATQL